MLFMLFEQWVNRRNCQVSMHVLARLECVELVTRQVWLPAVDPLDRYLPFPGMNSDSASLTYRGGGLWSMR